MRVRVIALVLLAALALGALAFAFAYGVVGRAPTPPGERIVAPRDAGAAGARDVLILGTSLTSRGEWPAHLETRLRSCAPDVRVERVARPGASSRWGLEALRRHLAEHEAPDVLVVEFSGNDAALARGFPLFVSRRLHRQIVAEAREAGATVILATMSPGWGREAWERPGQDRYHALYRDLAREEGTGLVDTIADWRALSPERRAQWVPDDLHPTDEAMRAIAAAALEEVLRPLVCGG